MSKAKLTVVSGGQSGVDRAALDVALESGIPTGGWCPEGRQAEDGIIDPRYPLEELPGGGYPERTLQNVIDSDGTVIIYFTRLSGGTKLTSLYCANQHKPHVLIDADNTDVASAVELIRKFIDDYKIGKVNIAGPRASKEPKAYDFTRRTLERLLK